MSNPVRTTSLAVSDTVGQIIFNSDTVPYLQINASTGISGTSVDLRLSGSTGITLLYDLGEQHNIGVTVGFQPLIPDFNNSIYYQSDGGITYATQVLFSSTNSPNVLVKQNNTEVYPYSNPELGIGTPVGSTGVTGGNAKIRFHNERWYIMHSKIGNLLTSSNGLLWDSIDLGSDFTATNDIAFDNYGMGIVSGKVTNTLDTGSGQRSIDAVPLKLFLNEKIVLPVPLANFPQLQMDQIYSVIYSFKWIAVGKNIANSKILIIESDNGINWTTAFDSINIPIQSGRPTPSEFTSKSKIVFQPNAQTHIINLSNYYLTRSAQGVWTSTYVPYTLLDCDSNDTKTVFVTTDDTDLVTKTFNNAGMGLIGGETISGLTDGSVQWDGSKWYLIAGITGTYSSVGGTGFTLSSSTRVPGGFATTSFSNKVERVSAAYYLTNAVTGDTGPFNNAVVNASPQIFESVGSTLQYVVSGGISTPVRTSFVTTNAYESFNLTFRTDVVSTKTLEFFAGDETFKFNIGPTGFKVPFTFDTNTSQKIIPSYYSFIPDGLQYARTRDKGTAYEKLKPLLDESYSIFEKLRSYNSGEKNPLVPEWLNLVMDEYSSELLEGEYDDYDFGKINSIYGCNDILKDDPYTGVSGATYSLQSLGRVIADVDTYNFTEFKDNFEAAAYLYGVSGNSILTFGETKIIERFNCAVETAMTNTGYTVLNSQTARKNLIKQLLKFYTLEHYTSSDNFFSKKLYTDTEYLGADSGFLDAESKRNQITGFFNYGKVDTYVDTTGGATLITEPIYYTSNSVFRVSYDTHILSFYVDSKLIHEFSVYSEDAMKIKLIANRINSPKLSNGTYGFRNISLGENSESSILLKRKIKELTKTKLESSDRKSYLERILKISLLPPGDSSNIGFGSGSSLESARFGAYDTDINLYYTISQFTNNTALLRFCGSKILALANSTSYVPYTNFSYENILTTTVSVGQLKTFAGLMKTSSDGFSDEIAFIPFQNNTAAILNAYSTSGNVEPFSYGIEDIRKILETYVEMQTLYAKKKFLVDIGATYATANHPIVGKSLLLNEYSGDILYNINNSELQNKLSGQLTCNLQSLTGTVLFNNINNRTRLYNFLTEVKGLTGLAKLTYEKVFVAAQDAIGISLVAEKIINQEKLLRPYYKFIEYLKTQTLFVPENNKQFDSEIINYFYGPTGSIPSNAYLPILGVSYSNYSSTPVGTELCIYDKTFPSEFNDLYTTNFLENFPNVYDGMKLWFPLSNALTDISLSQSYIQAMSDLLKGTTLSSISNLDVNAYKNLLSTYYASSLPVIPNHDNDEDVIFTNIVIPTIRETLQEMFKLEIGNNNKYFTNDELSLFKKHLVQGSTGTLYSGLTAGSSGDSNKFYDLNSLYVKLANDYNGYIEGVIFDLLTNVKSDITFDTVGTLITTILNGGSGLTGLNEYVTAKGVLDGLQTRYKDMLGVSFGNAGNTGGLYAYDQYFSAYENFEDSRLRWTQMMTDLYTKDGPNKDTSQSYVYKDFIVSIPPLDFSRWEGVTASSSYYDISSGIKMDIYIPPTPGATITTYVLGSTLTRTIPSTQSTTIQTYYAASMDQLIVDTDLLNPSSYTVPQPSFSSSGQVNLLVPSSSSTTSVFTIPSGQSGITVTGSVGLNATFSYQYAVGGSSGTTILSGTQINYKLLPCGITAMGSIPRFSSYYPVDSAGTGYTLTTYVPGNIGYTLSQKYPISHLNSRITYNEKSFPRYNPYWKYFEDDIVSYNGSLYKCKDTKRRYDIANIPPGETDGSQEVLGLYLAKAPSLTSPTGSSGTTVLSYGIAYDYTAITIADRDISSLYAWDEWHYIPILSGGTASINSYLENPPLPQDRNFQGYDEERYYVLKGSSGGIEIPVNFTTEQYKADRTYYAGDIVKWNNSLYKCRGGLEVIRGVGVGEPPNFSNSDKSWTLIGNTQTTDNIPPGSNGVWKFVDSLDTTGNLFLQKAFPEYDSTQIYNIGEYVTFLGKRYQRLANGVVTLQNGSTGSIVGISPTTTVIRDSAWIAHPYIDLTEEGKLIPAYETNKAYSTGDLVLYNNIVYKNILNSGLTGSEFTTIMPINGYAAGNIVVAYEGFKYVSLKDNNFDHPPYPKKGNSTYWSLSGASLIQPANIPEYNFQFDYNLAYHTSGGMEQKVWYDGAVYTWKDPFKIDYKLITKAAPVLSNLYAFGLVKGIQPPLPEPFNHWVVTNENKQNINPLKGNKAIKKYSANVIYEVDDMVYYNPGWENGSYYFKCTGNGYGNSKNEKGDIVPTRLYFPSKEVNFGRALMDPYSQTRYNENFIITENVNDEDTTIPKWGNGTNDDPWASDGFCRDLRYKLASGLELTTLTLKGDRDLFDRYKVYRTNFTGKPFVNYLKPLQSYVVGNTNANFSPYTNEYIDTNYKSAEFYYYSYFLESLAAQKETIRRLNAQINQIYDTWLEIHSRYYNETLNEYLMEDALRGSISGLPMYTKEFKLDPFPTDGTFIGGVEGLKEKITQLGVGDLFGNPTRGHLQRGLTYSMTNVPGGNTGLTGIGYDPQFGVLTPFTYLDDDTTANYGGYYFEKTIEKQAGASSIAFFIPGYTSATIIVNLNLQAIASILAGINSRIGYIKLIPIFGIKEPLYYYQSWYRNNIAVKTGITDYPVIVGIVTSEDKSYVTFDIEKIWKGCSKNTVGSIKAYKKNMWYTGSQTHIERDPAFDYTYDNYWMQESFDANKLGIYQQTGPEYMRYLTEPLHFDLKPNYYRFQEVEDTYNELFGTTSKTLSGTTYSTGFYQPASETSTYNNIVREISAGWTNFNYITQSGKLKKISVDLFVNAKCTLGGAEFPISSTTQQFTITVNGIPYTTSNKGNFSINLQNANTTFTIHVEAFAVEPLAQSRFGVEKTWTFGINDSRIVPISEYNPNSGPTLVNASNYTYWDSKLNIPMFAMIRPFGSIDRNVAEEDRGRDWVTLSAGIRGEKVAEDKAAAFWNNTRYTAKQEIPISDENLFFFQGKKQFKQDQHYMSILQYVFHIKKCSQLEASSCLPPRVARGVAEMGYKKEKENFIKEYQNRRRVLLIVLMAVILTILAVVTLGRALPAYPAIIGGTLTLTAVAAAATSTAFLTALATQIVITGVIAGTIYGISYGIDKAFGEKNNPLTYIFTFISDPGKLFFPDVETDSGLITRCSLLEDVMKQTNPDVSDGYVQTGGNNEAWGNYSQPLATPVTYQEYYYAKYALNHLQKTFASELSSNIITDFDIDIGEQQILSTLGYGVTYALEITPVMNEGEKTFMEYANLYKRVIADYEQELLFPIITRQPLIERDATLKISYLQWGPDVINVGATQDTLSLGPTGPRPTGFSGVCYVKINIVDPGEGFFDYNELGNVVPYTYNNPAPNKTIITLDGASGATFSIEDLYLIGSYCYDDKDPAKTAVKGLSTFDHFDNNTIGFNGKLAINWLGSDELVGKTFKVRVPVKQNMPSESFFRFQPVMIDDVFTGTKYVYTYPGRVSGTEATLRVIEEGSSFDQGTVFILRDNLDSNILKAPNFKEFLDSMKEIQRLDRQASSTAPALTIRGVAERGGNIVTSHDRIGDLPPLPASPPSSTRTLVQNNLVIRDVEPVPVPDDPPENPRNVLEQADDRLNASKVNERTLYDPFPPNRLNDIPEFVNPLVKLTKSETITVANISDDFAAFDPFSANPPDRDYPFAYENPIRKRESGPRGGLTRLERKQYTMLQKLMRGNTPTVTIGNIGTTVFSIVNDEATFATANPLRTAKANIPTGVKLRTPTTTTNPLNALDTTSADAPFESRLSRYQDATANQMDYIYNPLNPRSRKFPSGRGPLIPPNPSPAYLQRIAVATAKAKDAVAALQKFIFPKISVPAATIGVLGSIVDIIFADILVKEVLKSPPPATNCTDLSNISSRR